MDARQYYEKETLRNGLAVVIRAARPDDAERMVDAFKELDATSIYTRFFSPKKEITEAELQRFRETDFDTHVRLICTVERDGREVVIASALYVKISEDSAEVAFVVEEDYQRLGISKRLLSHLGKIALANGLKTFTAEVLPYNKAMLGVFQNCGWRMTSRTVDGAIHVTLGLEQ
ncbi:GNAT family N-acetyltransferase [Herbaspirillum sp. HC18]|nr:GNAT family N-acetyltransferase [Herbaspirillum sp. HC18]